LVDVLLLICFVVVGVSGIILKFVFVSGVPGAGRSVVFLGMNKMDLLPWHEFFGLSMIVLIGVHFVLHFNWVSCMTKSVFSKD